MAARNRFQLSRLFSERRDGLQEAALRILHGACAAALDAFHAADNPIDEQLVLDLEKMVERTRREIDRLSTFLVEPPS